MGTIYAEFLHAFENYDYDDLCVEILELKKNEG
jgi:hypothetical protein